MEKTFTKAIVLSATVFTAFMIVVPIGHLSAQNEIKIDEKVKFHKAVVSGVDFKSNALTITVDGVSVPVITNASTTVFFPNGDETMLPSVRDGSEVYIFGYYHPETRVINADKIVLRNKSALGRKTQSRAELRANDSLTSSLRVGEITLGNR
jgi:threonine dehydrogenase-like Zn-dependent dehydrogenase